MKKVLPALIMFILAAGYSQKSIAVQSSSHSSGQTDTSAYQTQRQKINTLLSDRSSKFGLYDSSLSKRTGIFGLKTKKDMQRSIDILTEIVITDNHIFKELKILLDYKDLEKTVVEDRVANNNESKNSYMHTIAKLQVQNDQLKTEIQKIEKEQTTTELFLYASVLLSLILAFLLFKSKY